MAPCARDDSAGPGRRGVSLLNTLPQQGPAHYRGLWPLLLASAGDEQAAAAIDEARRLGVTVNRVNRGLLGYAGAILAGRRGERELAADAARAADADLAHYPVWGDLAWRTRRSRLGSMSRPEPLRSTWRA